MRDDLIPIAPDGKRLTREEFAQKYWRDEFEDRAYRFIHMEVDDGPDEWAQLLINNIRALQNARSDDKKMMQWWVLDQLSMKQAADEGKDFPGVDAAKNPANDQPTKKVKRSNAPVDATLLERHPFLFILLGLLVGFIFRSLLELL